MWHSKLLYRKAWRLVHWTQLGKKESKGGKSWKGCETDKGHYCCMYLGEGGGARGHQNLTHTVVEALHWLIIHTQETLSCSLLSNLNHKVKVNYLWNCHRNKNHHWALPSQQSSTNWHWKGVQYASPHLRRTYRHGNATPTTPWSRSRLYLIL